MPSSPAKPGEADTEFAKARASGSSPAAIISAAIRQVANLHKMRLAIAGGDSVEFAMRRGAPPVHFSRENLVGEALRAWTPQRLMRAMEQLGEASLEMRRNAPCRKRSRNAFCCRSPRVHVNRLSKALCFPALPKSEQRNLELINHFSLWI